jgi:hypothetical protein
VALALLARRSFPGTQLVMFSPEDELAAVEAAMRELSMQKGVGLIPCFGRCAEASITTTADTGSGTATSSQLPVGPHRCGGARVYPGRRRNDRRAIAGAQFRASLLTAQAGFLTA